MSELHTTDTGALLKRAREIEELAGRGLWLSEREKEQEQKRARAYVRLAEQAHEAAQKKKVGDETV